MLAPPAESVESVPPINDGGGGGLDPCSAESVHDGEAVWLAVSVVADKA